MMDSLSVRAVLKVMEPPMALRVLGRMRMKKGNKEDSRRVTADKSGLTTNVGRKKRGRGTFKVRAYTHLSHCVPDAAELGELVYPFLADDRAVHIETHRFRSPKELLCFQESCHRAETISKTICQHDAAIYGHSPPSAAEHRRAGPSALHPVVHEAAKQ